MAEAVVGIVVEQLVSVAAGWMQEEISVLKGLKPKLDNMKSKMQFIQTVLEDAENQSVKKKIVKLWLEKLQDVSYDMNDVLDEWRTRFHIPEFTYQIVGSSPSTSATTCFSLKKLNCFSTVKQLPWRREIALRIKDINERIDSVFLQMKDFELVSKAVGNDDLNNIINRNDIDRLTTSFVDESKVYGRGDDKDFLLEKVLSMNTEQEKSLQVISIVGAGGLGKTTLAQMVYNDSKVEEKFADKRIWVCVSNPFDEFKVVKDILEGLKVDHTKMNSLQTLYQSVEESLSGDKFLLVLDDVWDEDFGKWERLSICLKHGDPDSRILVTTRKVEVARIMCTTQTNILKPRHISDLDCWFLMSQRAFQGRSNKDNHEFEDVGKEIAKKCKGLPLAAKTLGGMLISKDSIHEWKEMLSSEIWKLEQAEVELFPHIFLSYQELPSTLKSCFLILAMFPKDTKLKDKEVIAIWMAHDFLNQGSKEDDMVKTGQKYLKFLVSRALLEEDYSGISMHDIMHDFALHLSGDEFISIDKIKNDSGSKSTSERGSCLKSTTARHLYIEPDIDPASIGFDVGKLRTCIIRKVAPNVTSDLVKGLKMVRALYLARCGLEQVPPNIENLIHLKLLDLSGNRLLVELPETIGNLYNLQQLLLQYCGLSSLPNSIGKLTNLLLLDLSYNRRLVELPETIGGLYNLQQLLIEGRDLSSLPNSMGKLTNLTFLGTVDDDDNWGLNKFPKSVAKLMNLQNLGRFEVGENKLGLLKDLNQLRGKLEIEFCSEYGDEVDAKEAAIERKKHITELELDFNGYEVKEGVIAALQPHSNIQVLRMHHLPPNCVMLPSWITSLDHLTDLHVKGGNVSTLPPLGKLQSLKNLQISGFKALKMIGREFLGIGSKPDKNCSAFPKLVELKFHHCNELRGWEDLKPEEENSIIVMPNLEILEFGGCEKLGKLPRRLLGQTPSLKRFWIDSVFDFDVRGSPCRLYVTPCRIRGQRLEMIVEGSRKVPKSIIYHSYFSLLLDIYFAEQPIPYLPPMGKLPYLQSLKIIGFSSLELISRDFWGIDVSNNDEDFVAFPNLLNLEIYYCGWLREWEDLKPEDEGKVKVMPKLQRLQIRNCPKLQVLPCQLLCGAASLEELRCINNNDSFAENIKKDEQLMRHVKNVYVDDEQCSLHPSTKSENERGSGI